MSESESTDNSPQSEKHEPIIPALDAEHKRSGQIKERGEDSKDTGKKTTDSPKLSLFQAFMRKHFPDAKPHDRWQLIFTFVIAVSTFFYTIFAGWTLHEIHSGSIDTHRLAEAASKQATDTGTIATAAQDQVDAADNISDAADSFSDSADEIRDETTKAVGELKRTADDSETAINTASRNAQEALRISQRPYVTSGNTRFEPAIQSTDTQGVIKVDLHNSGRSPALKYTCEWKLFTDGVEGPTLPSAFPGEATIASDKDVTTALIVTFTSQDVPKAVIDGITKLSIKGTVHYTDIFKDSHKTLICEVWDAKDKLWKVCPGNDVE